MPDETHEPAGPAGSSDAHRNAEVRRNPRWSRPISHVICPFCRYELTELETAHCPECGLRRDRIDALNEASVLRSHAGLWFAGVIGGLLVHALVIEPLLLPGSLSIALIVGMLAIPASFAGLGVVIFAPWQSREWSIDDRLRWGARLLLAARLLAGVSLLGYLSLVFELWN